MTLLAVQYPWRYQSVFEPLVDFELINAKLYQQMPWPSPKLKHPVWVDYSMGMPDIHFVYAKEANIIPWYEEPGRNLLNAARFDLPGLKVGIWSGERRHLKLMEEAVDIVAIPYWEPRGVYVTPETAASYHFYGFCNCDELRRLRPRSLSTSVPITAACMGIDLKYRERRPKKLPPFNYDMVLTEEQIELAVCNIQSIREALGGEDGGL